MFSLIHIIYKGKYLYLPFIGHFIFTYLSLLLFITIMNNIISSPTNSHVIKVEPAKYYERLDAFFLAGEAGQLTSWLYKRSLSSHRVTESLSHWIKQKQIFIQYLEPRCSQWSKISLIIASFGGRNGHNGFLSLQIWMVWLLLFNAHSETLQWTRELKVTYPQITKSCSVHLIHHLNTDLTFPFNPS